MQQPDLLLIGIDVSKAKHDACIGTRKRVIQRKLTFVHSREGFQLFETVIRKTMFKYKLKRVLIAIIPMNRDNRPASPRSSAFGESAVVLGCPVWIRY